VNLDGERDPNAEEKDRWEELLLGLLLALLSKELKRLWPVILQLGQDFWFEERDAWVRELEAPLREMAQEAQVSFLAQHPEIGIDVAEANAAAGGWANRYAYDLVEGLQDTTRRALQQAIGNWLRTPGQSMESLYAALEPYFGRVRAEMIAITEVTRAFAEGERLLGERLQREGFRLEPVWNTANDERVCSVCAPNHRKRRSEGWTVDWPPPHPRCRCWITWVSIR